MISEIRIGSRLILPRSIDPGLGAVAALCIKGNLRIKKD